MLIENKMAKLVCQVKSCALGRFMQRDDDIRNAIAPARIRDTRRGDWDNSADVNSA